MRFLLDEMLPASIAVQLRRRGVDAIAVVEQPELVAATDEQVLTAASAEERAVVTVNLADFVRLDRQWLAEGRVHAGILLVSSKRFPQDGHRVGAITTTLLRRAKGADAPVNGFLEFL